MLRILELLGLGASDTSDLPQTASVRRIVAELEALGPERARFLAAFAYLLGRVAHADLDISAEELLKMEEIVEQNGDLPREQAALVIRLVHAEHLARGGTQNFQVAREFRQIADRNERRELLHCLFAVCAADDSISNSEEKQVRQIAEELGFSHREYVEVRSSYNEKRSVIHELRKTASDKPRA